MTVAALRSFGSICGKSSSSKRSGFTLQMASSFFFREDAFLDEVVGDHGFSLGGTFIIADLEEVQRGNAIDFFDRELGILHVFAFVLELLACGFKLFINGMESLVFVIAKGFERQGVTESCDVIYVCRAISLRSIRTAFGAMPCGHTRLCDRLCARPLRIRQYAIICSLFIVITKSHAINTKSHFVASYLFIFIQIAIYLHHCIT